MMVAETIGPLVLAKHHVHDSHGCSLRDHLESESVPVPLAVIATIRTRSPSQG